MDIEVIGGTNTIVRVSGVVDLSSINQFRAPLEHVVHGSPDAFIVDLSDVTYIDSAGIQAILSAYQGMLSTKGKIGVVVARPSVRYILTLTGIDRLPGLYMRDSLSAVEQALAEGDGGL